LQLADAMATPVSGYLTHPAGDRSGKPRDCGQWRSAAAEGSFAVYRQSIKLKLRGKDRNFADTRTFRAQEDEYPEVVKGDQLRHALVRTPSDRKNLVGFCPL